MESLLSRNLSVTNPSLDQANIFFDIYRKTVSFKRVFLYIEHDNFIFTQHVHPHYLYTTNIQIITDNNHCSMQMMTITNFK